MFFNVYFWCIFLEGSMRLITHNSLGGDIILQPVSNIGANITRTLQNLNQVVFRSFNRVCILQVTLKKEYLACFFLTWKSTWCVHDLKSGAEKWDWFLTEVTYLWTLLSSHRSTDLRSAVGPWMYYSYWILDSKMASTHLNENCSLKNKNKVF